MKRVWSDGDLELLRDRYAETPNAELAGIFGCSVTALYFQAQKLGARKSVEFRRRMRALQRTRRNWTPEQLRRLPEIYPDNPTSAVAEILGRPVPSCHAMAWKLGIRKSAGFMASPESGCIQKGRKIGAATCFRKGSVPMNKGLRRPGWGPGRMRETQFRKGGEPRNTLPLWSFRWCDGYLLLKTGKRGPVPLDGWEYVHKLTWEQAHGPLPHWRIARLWWKDGDHGNCSLDNLELVTAREHIARTTIQNFPPELRKTIQLAGCLKRRIRTITRKEAK